MTNRQPVERYHRITNDDAIDLHVGKRLRLHRTLLGMSQEQFGAEPNITFQQVQKYERGANRISASRLRDMGHILDVPVSYFFDDMSETTMRSSPRRVERGFVNGSAADGESRIRWHAAKRLSLCGHIIQSGNRRYTNACPIWSGRSPRR
jgi:transcriptional regulator with XRE-family HTH domain